MLIELLAYCGIGIFAGLTAGLLGVGGGLIIVPLLLFIFQSQAIPLPEEHHAHIAIATSLATIIFTSISAILAQQKKQAILWPLVSKLIPGIMLGSFIGAWLTARIPHQPLVIIFIVFLILVASKMLMVKPVINKPESTYSNKPFELLHSLILFIISTIIGIVSALVGIGGGTMTVPYLTQYFERHYSKQGTTIANIPLKNAIAVSSTLGLPIAIFGSLGFLSQSLLSNSSISMLGSDNFGAGSFSSGSFGYIYLPAFICISIFAFITAKFGVYLSHRLNKKIVMRVFALLLIIQAIKLFSSII